MKYKSLISIVVPVFNEEQVVIETYRRLTEVFDSIDVMFEIVFVNDGSTDNSVQILSGICKKDSRIKMVNLSRNFGQMASISAGIEYSRGDAVVIIDADLQDPPEVISKMIEKWQEGYDVVYGKRIKRNDETLFKKAASKLFFRVLKRLTDIEVPIDSGDFRLIDRKVCDCLLKLPERNRFMRGLISWVGFKQYGLEYVREGRFAGKTKYSVAKLTNLAVSGFTSMTYKPMRISLYTGLLSLALCFIAMVFYIVSSLIKHTDISFSGMLLMCNLLIGSFILIAMGLNGEYLGKVYDESKGRPLYIVRDTLGIETENNIAKTKILGGEAK